jgi:hypothetical protein
MDVDGSRSARAALVAALDVVGLAPSERFDRIVRIAREVFDVPFASIDLLDDTLLRTLTPDVPGGSASGPLEWSFSQLTVQRPGPTVVRDTLADARTADLPGVTRGGIRFSAGVPLSLPGELTIGSLCLMDVRPREFTPQDEAALIDLGRWTEQALTKGLQHDRLLEVVEALAPQPVHVPGYELAGLSVPYGDLSGDVHDWAVAEDAVTFLLADIMGKEQPAALLAAGLRAALRQHDGLPPVAAVGAVEPRMTEDLGRASAFATLFHSRLTPSTGRIDFVDAGHGLVLHLHADGTSEILRSRDLPLGLHPEGVPFRRGSLVLKPGDVLLVASDGVLDLGDGTIDTLTDIGRTFRRAPHTAAFLETVRLRAAEHAEDDVTVAVLARDTAA